MFNLISIQEIKTHSHYKIIMFIYFIGKKQIIIMKNPTITNIEEDIDPLGSIPRGSENDV